MQNVAISLSTNGRDKVSTSGRGISFRFLPALLENPSLLASVDKQLTKKKCREKTSERSQKLKRVTWCNEDL